MSETQEMLSSAPTGVVTVSGDAWQVVFNRHYRKPIEKVWAAITTPERMADWFAIAQIDMKVGGAIKLDWHGHNSMEGRVVALDRPHVFAWTWMLGERETVVRFELEADGDGCNLTLTHSGLNPEPGRGQGVRAGWHAHLEALPDAMEGRRTPFETTIARRDVLQARYPAEVV